MLLTSSDIPRPAMQQQLLLRRLAKGHHASQSGRRAPTYPKRKLLMIILPCQVSISCSYPLLPGSFHRHVSYTCVFSSFCAYCSTACEESNLQLASRRSTKKRRKNCTSSEAPLRSCRGRTTTRLDWCKTCTFPPFFKRKIS